MSMFSARTGFWQRTVANITGIDGQLRRNTQVPTYVLPIGFFQIFLISLKFFVLFGEP
jgi:hypothetical protein